MDLNGINPEIIKTLVEATRMPSIEMIKSIQENALQAIKIYDMQFSRDKAIAELISTRVQLIQNTLASCDFYSILDRNISQWNRSFEIIQSQFDVYSVYLRNITYTFSRFEEIINNQKIGFENITYIKPYQKRAMLRHEEKQKETLQLGFDDISVSKIVDTNVQSTTALINGIAKINDDEPKKDRSEFEDEVFKVLSLRGEEYLVPLHGAIITSKSNNPDKVRQTIISLRELTMHILHNLSPNEEILKWSDNPDHFVKGQPTRKCRIEYIFRACSGSKIKPFIENEVKFTKDFFDYLNNGTHALISSITDRELEYIVYKTESIILLLCSYAKN
jgi:hypothetical protein